MKFRTGLLTGALVGGVYGLLTAKRSGVQTQKAIANYLEGITDASENVTSSLQKLQGAVSEVVTESKTTLKSAHDEINRLVTDFQFQAEPRVTQINETVTKLKSDLNLPEETDDPTFNPNDYQDQAPK